MAGSLGYKLRPVYYRVESNGAIIVNSVISVRAFDLIDAEYIAHALLRNIYSSEDRKVRIYCSYRAIGGDLVQKEVS